MMIYLVKVKVDPDKLVEFGSSLRNNDLDRSCIRGETYCHEEDPAVGFSIWEAEDDNVFNLAFDPWRAFYSETEIRKLITPVEAMNRLLVR
jgi:hypothetical protein